MPRYRWGHAWWAAIVGLVMVVGSPPSVVVGAEAPVPIAGGGPVTRQHDDLAPYLPPGGRILKTASGDLDGDSRPDTVVVYELPGGPGQKSLLQALVVAGNRSAGAPRALFAPPGGSPDAPLYGLADSVALEIRDLDGAGRAGAALTLIRPGSSGHARSLWIFTWDGSEYAPVIVLEGHAVELLAGPGGRGTELRLAAEERLWGMVGAPVVADQVYRWRDGGFRLDERSLRPVAPSRPNRPESAVVSYYGAIAGGDYQGAYALLAPRFQAEQPYERFAAGFATTRSVHLEELRLDPGFQGPLELGDDATIYVRLRAVDDGPSGRTTGWFAGTWRLERQGERWLLVSARIQATVSLAELADALPPGTSIVQTAEGDLRGRSTNDLAAVVRHARDFLRTETVIFLRSDRGLQATSLRDLLPDGEVGFGAVSVAIADVNAEGLPELVVSHHWLDSWRLWVVGWDGGRPQQLFRRGSEPGAARLRDLDGDGRLEIVVSRSGCGTAVDAPALTLVHRWRDGAYRAATADFPTLQDGFIAVAAQSAGWAEGTPHEGSAYCHHMTALAHAFQGHGADALRSYQQYLAIRPTPRDMPGHQVMSVPLYYDLSAMRDDIQHLTARVEAGQLGVWEPRERAMLHDIVANLLEDEGRSHEQSAEQMWRGNDHDQYREINQLAKQMLDDAAVEYRAALAIDPTDPEAQAGLTRLRR